MWNLSRCVSTGHIQWLQKFGILTCFFVTCGAMARICWSSRQIDPKYKKEGDGKVASYDPKHFKALKVAKTNAEAWNVISSGCP